MKRMLVVLMLLVLFLSSAMADPITIDPQTASDEELAAAISLLTAEQRSRVQATIEVDITEFTIGKGKAQTVTASVTGLQDGLTAGAPVWSSSDPAVVTVKDGLVKGIAPGDAVVTVAVTLSNEVVLTEDIAVHCVIPVTALSMSQKQIVTYVGDVCAPVIKFSPATATVQTLTYTTSDADVVMINEDGDPVAVKPGSAVVTATAQDGTGKSVSFTVSVPTIKPLQSSYVVTGKKGDDFTFAFSGNDHQDVTVAITGKGNSAVMSYDEAAKIITVHVAGAAAGSATLTITDKQDAASKLSISVKIDHSAVYDTASYPAIKYKDAFRYPENYKGKTVSFSGKVLQVMNGTFTTTFRISSKGRYSNVVYVTINNSDINTPILENDRVTVFGVYDGTYSYTALFGNEITIPYVKAERINVR